MTDDDTAQKLLASAQEVCRLIEVLERRGRDVDLNIDWENGLTPALQRVKSWSPKLVVDGITVR